MIRVPHEEGMLIREDGLCLLEGHAVLALVAVILGLIPLEAKVAHRCQCNYKVGQGEDGSGVLTGGCQSLGLRPKLYARIKKLRITAGAGPCCRACPSRSGAGSCESRFWSRTALATCRRPGKSWREAPQCSRPSGSLSADCPPGCKKVWSGRVSPNILIVRREVGLPQLAPSRRRGTTVHRLAATVCRNLRRTVVAIRRSAATDDGSSSRYDGSPRLAASRRRCPTVHRLAATVCRHLRR